MEMRDPNITGIILAGGKSSRMGRDKGVVPFQGSTMIEHVIQALEQVVSKIIIIANNDNYDRFGYPVIKDVVKECGPMGGIMTGLLNSTTELNLVVSCDIPLVSVPLLFAIAKNNAEADVVAPFINGEFEPLCARYKRSCAEQMTRSIEKGMLKMRILLEDYKVHKIDPLTIAGFDRNQLTNINTPTELEHSQKQ